MKRPNLVGDEKTYQRVKDHLSWVKTMLKAPVSRRHAWFNAIIDGIRSYRDKTTHKKDALWLSDIIQDDATWEVIGFAVNQQYVRMDGDKDLLDAIWVHPWGTPNLVLKHRKLPLIITVGPGIRWNESILGEMTKNAYDESVRGITG